MFYIAMFTGLMGLVAMGVLGMSHGGHAQHGSGHAQDSHNDQNIHRDGSNQEDFFSHLLVFFSPRTLFSLAIGFGTSGLVLQQFLPNPASIFLAIICAFLFEKFFIGPYWRSMFAFASKPASNLESLLGARATAIGQFNSQGMGLVMVKLDGENRQLLGMLRKSEIASTRVNKNDSLFITAVSKSGQLEVSKG